MKTVPVLLAISIAFVHCGPPRLTHTGESTSEMRYNSGASPRIDRPGTKNNSNANDTVVVTGSEYLKVLGRNENGMYPDLEGTWELQAMPKANLTSNKNNIVKDAASTKDDEGKPYTGEAISPSMKGSTEVGRETTTSKSADGTVTSTTVYLVNKNHPEKKITPPQGNNYHNPEKPSINLFGSNETFSGFTGCNKIAGRYSITKNNGITFRHSAPSTRMVCIGEYDEKVFLNSLKRVNKYRSTGSELQLMDGDEVLFVFARK